MKIENTQRIENHFVKAILYGESGAGKTTLAGTLNGKTLIINGESKLSVLAGKDIDVINLALDDERKLILEPTKRLARLREAYLFLNAGTNYKNVFIDSLTEISDLIVRKVQAEFTDPKASIKMWGENLKHITDIVKSFRDLPNYNVFMTCVSEAEKDENNRRYMGFQLAGSISKKLPQYFDEVFYLQKTNDGKRQLITRGTDTIYAKDCSNTLSPIEEPDLGLIVAKILKPRKVESA